MSSTETASENENHTSSTRAKKNHLTLELKQFIVDEYKREFRQHPDYFKNEIVQMVTDKVGVCRATVFRVIKEFKLTKTLSKPKTNQNRSSLIESLKEWEKQSIRFKVYEFYLRNDTPTFDKVLKVVNDDAGLPAVSRSTFYKVLKHLKFKFKKHGINSILLDKPEVVRLRRDYLVAVKEYRRDGRKIYYLGETTVDVDDGQTPQTVKARRLRNRAGPPKALVICHIGSKDGFVNDAFWTFEMDKTQEFTTKPFEQWFSKTLPLLEDNSIIILDNAPHHTRKLHKLPTINWRKSDIQNWLREKEIDFDETMLKYQLLDIVKIQNVQFNEYVIDEIALQQNKVVLRLPPYHSELNPLEPIWAEAKDFVAKRNKTGESSDMTNLFVRALNYVSRAEWRMFVEHIEQIVEKKMWTLDDIMERQEEQFIRSVGDYDDSDTVSSSSE